MPISVALVFAGKTEHGYLEQAKDARKCAESWTLHELEGGDPTKIRLKVEDLIDSVDRIVVLIDDDRRPPYCPEGEEAAWKELDKLLSNREVSFITSFPYFEVWLLCHYLKIEDLPQVLMRKQGQHTAICAPFGDLLEKLHPNIGDKPQHDWETLKPMLANAYSESLRSMNRTTHPPGPRTEVADLIKQLGLNP